MFLSVHVGEKCRALGVARFRGVQFMGAATASTCVGAFFGKYRAAERNGTTLPVCWKNKVQISSVSSQLGGQLMTTWRASVPGARSEYWNSTDLGHADFYSRVINRNGIRR